MGGTVSIRLTHGKSAILNVEDIIHVREYRWHAVEAGRHQKIWYAVAFLPARDQHLRTIYMHRAILQPPPGIEVDHLDHNGLNNTRENLRLRTHLQNLLHQRKQENTSSRFRGVTYFTPGQRERRWMAQLKHQKHNYVLGYYATEEEAARAYDQKALEIWGQDANLNFRT